jgi:hypothetical protein
MLRPNSSVLQLAHDYQVLPKGQQTGTSPASLVRVTTTAPDAIAVSGQNIPSTRTVMICVEG